MNSIKNISQVRERAPGKFVRTGVTNEMTRALNGLQPAFQMGQVETPPPWPMNSVVTLFTVDLLPDDMPAASGSGSGSSGGVQKKACYASCHKISDSSKTPTLVRLLYPHAVGDQFYATSPDGGAGWAYQHTWYQNDPTDGSGDGTYPPVASGSGAYSWSGTDEFTTADPIGWIEQYSSAVNFNVYLVQDGGDNTAPTYSAHVGSISGSTVATQWAPKRSRILVDSSGLEIVVADGGHAEFDPQTGAFFISSTDEQYGDEPECGILNSGSTESGSGS